MIQAEPIFVDSNVPMYAGGREHPYRDPCQKLLQRVATGDVQAVTSSEVHQEILHRYLAMGMGTQAREVSEDFETAIPNVLPVTLADVRRARDLSRQYEQIPARDLLHVAVMLNNGIRWIATADRHFDRVGEIERLDPVQWALAERPGT